MTELRRTLKLMLALRNQRDVQRIVKAAWKRTKTYGGAK